MGVPQFIIHFFRGFSLTKKPSVWGFPWLWKALHLLENRDSPYPSILSGIHPTPQIQRRTKWTNIEARKWTPQIRSGQNWPTNFVYRKCPMKSITASFSIKRDLIVRSPCFTKKNNTTSPFLVTHRKIKITTFQIVKSNGKSPNKIRFFFPRGETVAAQRCPSPRSWCPYSWDVRPSPWARRCEPGLKHRGRPVEVGMAYYWVNIVVNMF